MHTICFLDFTLFGSSLYFEHLFFCIELLLIKTYAAYFSGWRALHVGKEC